MVVDLQRIKDPAQKAEVERSDTKRGRGNDQAWPAIVR